MSGRAMGLRLFVFEPDGKLRCVSKQSFNRLVSRQGAIPQFSGQRLRDVEVTVECDGKRAVRILKMHFGYWVLDSTGMFDDSDRLDLERASLSLRTERIHPQSSNLVSLSKIRKSKQTIAASKWTPSEQQVAQIVGAIWPERRAPGTRKPTFLRIDVGRNSPTDHD
jgi:hypothetical protein